MTPTAVFYFRENQGLNVCDQNNRKKKRTVVFVLKHASACHGPPFRDVLLLPQPKN